MKLNSKANVSSIGNLLLIDKVTNGEKLRNKSPKEKIKILGEQNYPFSVFDDFESSLEWNNQSIQERTKKMAGYIYDVLRKEIELN